jgi:hypothetical protein
LKTSYAADISSLWSMVTFLKYPTTQKTASYTETDFP